MSGTVSVKRELSSVDFLLKSSSGGGAVYEDGERKKDPRITIAKIVVLILLVLLALEAVFYTLVIPCLAPVKVQKRKRAEAEAEAMELLERVGLADRKNDYPRQLSGGQKQRIAIVRALIMHPEVLLLDEITAALDPEMVHEVLQVVLDLAKSGSTMLIVTHEMAFAKAIADRVLFFEHGEIVEESHAPKAFFERPQTERARQFLKSFEY